MVLSRSALAAVCILTCAFVSLVTWRFEIGLVRGAEGTGWIYAFPLSSVIVCAMVAISVEISMSRERLLPPKARISVLILVMTISFAAFVWSRIALIESEQIHITLFETVLRRVYVPLVVSALGASIGIHLVVRKWRRTGKWLFARCLLGIFFAVPLGILSVRVFSDARYDVVNVVKMGHPMFWVTLLIGLAVWPTGKCVPSVTSKQE